MMRPFYVGPIPDDAPGVMANLASAEPVKIRSIAPNPFNPQVEIRFDVRTAGRVDAIVYDVRGAEVCRLAGDDLPTGIHALRWNGRDARGVEVSSGVYFLRIVSNGFVDTRKLIMVR
jgi:hypothetical protein